LFEISRRSEGSALHLGERRPRFAWLGQEPPECPWTPAFAAGYLMRQDSDEVTPAASKLSSSPNPVVAFGPAHARSNFFYAQNRTPSALSEDQLRRLRGFRQCGSPRGLALRATHRSRSNPAACLEPSTRLSAKFKISLSRESFLGRTQFNACGPQTTVFHFNVSDERSSEEIMQIFHRCSAFGRILINSRRERSMTKDLQKYSLQTL